MENSWAAAWCTGENIDVGGERHASVKVSSQVTAQADPHRMLVDTFIGVHSAPLQVAKGQSRPGEIKPIPHHPNDGEPPENCTNEVFCPTNHTVM
jgi:hypothetical protein